MRFEVYGPFEISRGENGLVDSTPSAKRKFWTEANAVASGLANARGCYVFAVRAKRGTLPWYVGRTNRSFSAESLGAHQINHYNQAIAGKIGVAPLLFLIAKQTDNGRFAKAVRKRGDAIEFLEIFLCGLALQRNRRLRNSKNTAYPRFMSVPGIINSPPGKPTKPARLLRGTFFA